jgi:P27 family predicted phage terminase small subunit
MTYSRWIQAEQDISEYGILIKDPIFDKEGVQIGERLKKNPACTAAMALQRELRSLLGLFGLDPTSRTRLKTNTAEEKESPLVALLRQRQEKRAQQRAS